MTPAFRPNLVSFKLWCIACTCACIEVVRNMPFSTLFSPRSDACAGQFPLSVFPPSFWLTLVVKQHVREIYSLFIQEEILRHPSPLQASWFCKENCLGIGNWTFMWHLQRQCIPLEEDMSPWEDTTMTSLPLIRGTTWEASVPAVFPFPEPIPQEIPQRQRSAEWGAVSSKKIPRTVRNICGKEIDRLWAGAVQHRFVRFPSIDFFLVAPCKQSI